MRKHCYIGKNCPVSVMWCIWLMNIHVLFMQCATHLNLGWRITVLNEGDPIPTTAPPPTVSRFTDPPTTDSQLTRTPPSTSSRKIGMQCNHLNQPTLQSFMHVCLHSSHLFVSNLLHMYAMCRNWDWSTANRAAWSVWDTVRDQLKNTLIWRLQLWWFRTRYVMKCFFQQDEFRVGNVLLIDVQTKAKGHTVCTSAWHFLAFAPW